MSSSAFGKRVIRVVLRVAVFAIVLPDIGGAASITCSWGYGSGYWNVEFGGEYMLQTGETLLEVTGWTTVLPEPPRTLSGGTATLGADGEWSHGKANPDPVHGCYVLGSLVYEDAFENIREAWSDQLGPIAGHSQ